jgi:tetratricopeptide (TPR) repeat protein
MTKKTNHFSLPAAKHTLLIPVVLLLLWSAYLCFRWALADVLAEQVWHRLDKNQIATNSLNAEQWRKSRNWLEDSLQLHPNYSGNLELAEFFYITAANQPAELQDELGWHDNYEQALNYTRRALTIKPTWPFLWSELVLIKVNLQQFDSELTGAIERAVNLGPWEKSVQYDVALTGLDYWDNLEIAAHKWITMAMDKTLIMQKNPKLLLDDVFAHPNIDKLCISANEMPENNLKMLARYCKQPQDG